MTPQPLSHEMWFAQFDSYLHRQGYRAQTAHRYRTVCRQFLQYLQERNIALEQVDVVVGERAVPQPPREAHHAEGRREVEQRVQDGDGDLGAEVPDARLKSRFIEQNLAQGGVQSKCDAADW